MRKTAWGLGWGPSRQLCGWLLAAMLQGCAREHGMGEVDPAIAGAEEEQVGATASPDPVHVTPDPGGEARPARAVPPVPWSFSISGEQNADLRVLGADSTGNTYVVAEYEGEARFKGLFLPDHGVGIEVPRPVEPPHGDLLLAKLDPAGEVVWAKALGADKSGLLALRGRVDAADRVWIWGSTWRPLDIGSCHLEASFVVRLSPAGDCEWSRSPQPILTRGPAAAVDSAGNMVVVDRIDGTTLSLWKLDTQGEVVWQQTFAGRSRDHLVEVDGHGHIVVAGTLEEDLQLGPTTLVAETNVTGFIAQFDADGHPNWGIALSNGASVGSEMRSMVLLEGGQVAVSGPGALAPLPVVKNRQTYLALVDHVGKLVWAQHHPVAEWATVGRGSATDELVVVSSFDLEPAGWRLHAQRLRVDGTPLQEQVLGTCICDVRFVEGSPQGVRVGGTFRGDLQLASPATTLSSVRSSYDAYGFHAFWNEVQP